MLTFTAATSGESNADELLTSINVLSVPVSREDVRPYVVRGHIRVASMGAFRNLGGGTDGLG